MTIHILVILGPRALARRLSASVAAGPLIPLDSYWNDMRLRHLRPVLTSDSYNDGQLGRSCLALNCDPFEDMQPQHLRLALNGDLFLALNGDPCLALNGDSRLALNCDSCLAPTSEISA